MVAYLISVVSPMYNVGRYLADYFESLEAQTFGFENLEVVLVDDGSTDDTGRLARAFAAKHPANVQYVRQDNGGQASARNAGLARVSGAWVTFPDPDDTLSPNYFRDVAALMDSPGGADASMFTARMLLWFEDRPAGRAVRDTHALAGRFEGGTRVVELNTEPTIVQAHVTTGFFRVPIIRTHDLRFREDLRVRFEDGNFVSRYLLTFAQPTVGMVATSDYHYRQRADASSTIQSGAADPRKYTDTVRNGYLDVVRAAEGKVPRWAQNLMIYDMLWLFRSSQTAAVRQARFPASMHDELEELMPAWLAHMDDDAISTFSIMPVADWMREALLLLKHGDGHSPAHFGSVDAKRGLVSVVYRYRGPRPAEVVRVGRQVIEPRYTKDLALEFAGRRVVWQRYLWLALGEGISLELNGTDQPIRMREHRLGTERIETQVISTRAAIAAAKAEPPATSLKAVRRLRRRVGIVLREVKAIARDRPRPLEAVDRLVRAWRAMSPRLARRFAAAWVFIDRDVDANDSAEVLYKWVAAEHPEVNSWFVLRRDSPDWQRLENEGVRLVPYGTTQFASLMLSAEHVASSHADRFVSDPLPGRYGRKAWNFTFLQHGVIKGDISGWLNSKAIATFVTSTQDEYDYIAGPSPYRFGPKEVRLTGLPRFDALLAQDSAVADTERNIILVMPTWRDYLVGSMSRSSRDREGVSDFGDTEYARALQSFLASEELQSLAGAHGLRIVFMPHPNMHVYLHRFDLPAQVEVLSYDDVEVRDMIVHARVLVTDYSSTAFNMAYVQRPVVYFQFDQEQYYAGHTERPGYFDYGSHGFGPVRTDVDSAVQAVVDAIAGQADPRYLERMQRAFPVRDGQNCRRVFDAMIESRVTRPFSERTRAAEPDTWDEV